MACFGGEAKTFFFLINYQYLLFVICNASYMQVKRQSHANVGSIFGTIHKNS